MNAPSGPGPASDVERALGAYVVSRFPRVLTHLDRDPDSPTHGCFDRTFWHYKTLDFASAILQQSVITLHHAAEGRIPLPHHDRDRLRAWAQAAISFWATLPAAGGGLNEYYPFESGYPPTAFSLQAVSSVLPSYTMTDPIRRQLQRTADYLLGHFEKEALNQQAAGLAGLALAARLPGVRNPGAGLERIADRFFATQSPEGWFPEYGGPDLGYLTVTLDMLWDYHDATGDGRTLEAIRRAIEYIAWFIAPDDSVAGLCNSRTTDYIVPYGLARAGATDPVAAEIVRRVFRSAISPGHFLASVDDRYHLHYIYNSCVRSLPHLAALTSEPATLPCDTHVRKHFPAAANFVEHRGGSESVFCAVKKGGATTLVSRDGRTASDFGWRCRTGQRLYVSNYWSEGAACLWPDEREGAGGATLRITAPLVPVTYFRPSPLRHFVLRVVSRMAGTRLMPMLKNLLIFRKARGAVRLARTITLGNDRVTIADEITGLPPEARAWRAARPSARHVSSAGSFAWEEIASAPAPAEESPLGREVVRVLAL